VGVVTVGGVANGVAAVNVEGVAAA